MKTGNLLGIFAKFWQPGQVKTRLAVVLGPDRAAAVARACVACLIDRFRNLADERVIAFAPAEKSAPFAELAGADYQLWPQADGDLGQRLRAFFARAFSQGAERVVVIGSDSPTLPRTSLDAAFAQLADHDLVLGPAEDGGYYLLGARPPVPPIFTDIAWSTDQVLAQTLAAASSAALRCTLLPPWWDVDEPADLLRLRRELHAAAALSAPEQRLRTTLDEALETS